MQFLFVTPQIRPSADTVDGQPKPITGVMSVGYLRIDDNAHTVTADFAAIEDAASGGIVLRTRPVTVTFTPTTTYAQTQAAFKAAVSAALNNVAFQ